MKRSDGLPVKRSVGLPVKRSVALPVKRSVRCAWEIHNLFLNKTARKSRSLSNCSRVVVDTPPS